jgi:transposase
MAAAVAFRSDYTATGIRALARSSGDANQVRRLLTLAMIYEGGTRSEAARVGGVGLQTVRDWVLRFNAAGPEGLIDGVPPGGVALLDDTQRGALADIVESGPIPASHGVVRWRLIDLAQWVWDEFAITISKQTLSRELRAMDYRKLTARPRHHAQDADAIPAFKKTSPPRWRRSGQRSRTVRQ